MKKFTFLLGIMILGVFCSVKAQDIEVEAEDADVLNGQIKLNAAGDGLESIKAVNEEGSYDATITYAEFEGVDIPSDGTYSISAFTSGFQSEARITVSIDGTEVDTLELVNTGNWGTYEWSSVAEVELSEGSQTVRLTFWHTGESDGYLCNIDKFQIQSGVQTAINRFSNDDVNVYPNPASSFVNIHLEGRQRANVSVYSLTGKKVLTNNLISGQNVINTSSLSRGMYLLEIEESNKTVTKKLIIE